MDESEKVLVLEDDPVRLAWFLSEFPGATVAHTASAAILALEGMGDFAIVFLDHDLLPEHYSLLAYGVLADERGTGSEVSAWLRDHPLYSRDAIVVLHSMNAEGSNRMAGHLREANRLFRVSPFPLLQRAAVLMATGGSDAVC